MARLSRTALLLCAALAEGGIARGGGRQATALESPPATQRLIGYFDAGSQLELPVTSIPHQNLTHVVLTNAVKVDSQGELHYRPKGHPSELDVPALVRFLASLPIKLVVSLRGHEDDVALDELAEVDALREAFTTNMAVLIRRQEFNSSAFVQHYIDWLALRAYSMRSLGDPHHSSLKDMRTALDEWVDRGVPRRLLVLGVPLFARPGAALSTANDRNEALRLSWRELAGSRLLLPPGGDRRGDTFTDPRSGKTWWASGPNTTRAKVRHVLEGGYGGVALRDLHLDAAPGDEELSLVRAASGALREPLEQRRRLARPMSLFQRAVTRSRADVEQRPDEL